MVRARRIEQALEALRPWAEEGAAALLLPVLMLVVVLLVRMLTSFRSTPANAPGTV